MKLKIRESNFSVTASVDERIKTTKNKLVVKRPTTIKLRPSDKKNKLAIKSSTLWTIRPKIGGIVLNSKKNNTIHKTSNGDGLVFNQSVNNAVLKYENGAALLVQRQDSYAVYKQLKVVDIFSPDYTPNGITWGSDWDQSDPNDPDAPQLVYSVGERVNSTTPQINGINTPIQLEISWNNYDSKLGITHDTISPDAEWTVSVNSSASYGGSITDLNDSPVNITVSNGQYIIFSLYSDATINNPQIRTYTIKNKSSGNAVLDEFTMGSYAYISLL